MAKGRVELAERREAEKALSFRFTQLYKDPKSAPVINDMIIEPMSPVKNAPTVNLIISVAGTVTEENRALIPPKPL